MSLLSVIITAFCVSELVLLVLVQVATADSQEDEFAKLGCYILKDIMKLGREPYYAGQTHKPKNCEGLCDKQIRIFKYFAMRLGCYCIEEGDIEHPKLLTSRKDVCSGFEMVYLFEILNVLPSMTGQASFAKIESPSVEPKPTIASDHRPTDRPPTKELSAKFSSEKTIEASASKVAASSGKDPEFLGCYILHDIMLQGRRPDFVSGTSEQSAKFVCEGLCDGKASGYTYFALLSGCFCIKADDIETGALASTVKKPCKPYLARVFKFV